MRIIASDTFGILNSAWESRVSSFPAVFTLCHSGVHISSSNCCNIPSNIEAMIDEALSSAITLDIPNIDPDDWHVRFRWYFDNSQFENRSSIVEDLVLLYNGFDITGGKIVLRITVWKIRDVYYFKIGLWLWKVRNFNLEGVNVIWILDILFYDLQIWLQRYLVSNNCDT